ncbi:MAG: monovalent cation/H+ antiporter subunit D family protein [Pseudomonadota bacterium]
MSGIEAHLPALQVVAPLIIAPLVVLLHPRGLAWAAATLVSIYATINAVSLTAGTLAGRTFNYKMGSWDPPFGIELNVDALAAILLLIITGASSLALIASERSVSAQIEVERQPLFYAAWLLALAGLSGIVVTADAFNIFVFMEIASLASYVLIAGGPDRRALPAVFKYLIIGTVGATFYLIGVGLIYLMTGTLNIADIVERLPQVSDQNTVLAAVGFITVGLALKAAVFPMHVWLPNAYTYAPHAVTVFLAACSTKVQLYVLIRMDFIAFQPSLTDHAIQFSQFLMPLAILGILFGSAVAIFEQNLKRLFAYSSVAQIGYIVLGAALVTETGLIASIVHMFNHALAKGTLFLAAAGLAVHFSGLRLSDLSGAAKRMPWTMAALVAAALSLIGIPGTAGFVSKWYLLSAVLEKGGFGYVLAGVIVISSLMAVIYIWKIVEATYFGEPGDDTATVREAPTPLLAATWAGALANVYFGLQPYVPATLSTSAAQLLMGGAP